ncbi:hypothetical protein CI109_101641 [Kwoniella shandongensis]|uniref:Uncharacterized protein n=1 Tax=Kwoniella shandongensis TaxID=1734106 RepID=A0A5M6C6I6_9TREE|nr:uncharacterized protein CI109_001234 [Kwoniella shandongensis]KAA5530431.1 hypothetical protein CI109_001234 [Kwoniella shandongensis]
MLLLTILSLALPIKVHSRTPLYGPCNVTNNHLDADTKDFITDCDSFGFCSINGTCLPRQCRQDEYLMTSLLDPTHVIPPLCPTGSFCPDDASGCLPLVELGGVCQLNRDDECAPPPNGAVLILPSPYDEPQGDGSICLLGTCMWTNASLGSSCVTETITYVGYDLSGMSYTNTVIRDNCIEGQGYCDLTANQCFALATLGVGCKSDRECQSFNCGSAGICIMPPESAVRVAKWIYAVVSLSIGISMVGVLWLLIVAHRRAQKKRRIMLEDYYKEQTAYRNSIISFHTAFASRDKPFDSEKETFRQSLSNLSDTTLVQGDR